jgi:hypothetical protein
MVAGYEAHLVRRPERLKPCGRKRKFGFKPDIQDVPGHRNVIGFLRMNIGDDRGQHVHTVRKRSPAPPIHVAGDALTEKLAPMRAGKGADMGVGEMGEEKAHANSLGRREKGVKLCQPRDR